MKHTCIVANTSQQLFRHKELLEINWILQKNHSTDYRNIYKNKDNRNESNYIYIREAKWHDSSRKRTKITNLTSGKVDERWALQLRRHYTT